MATTCPALNSFTSKNPDLVTVQNQKELRLSTYEKVPGTVVTLWCEQPFNLYGQSKVTCQSNGNWDFSTKPCCDNADCNGTTSTGLTEQTKILIGVLVAVVAVIVIVLLVIICIIMSKLKQKEREKKKLYHDNDSSSSNRLGYMLDERAFFPPPYSYHPNAHPYDSFRRNLGKSPENIQSSSAEVATGSSANKKNNFATDFIDSGQSVQNRNRPGDGEFERPGKFEVSTVDNIYRGSPGFYSSSVDGDHYSKPFKYRSRSVESDYGLSKPYQMRATYSELSPARNAFVENAWNKPLDNVYVPKSKNVPPQKKPTSKGSSLPSTVYTGHWPARSEMKELKEFNRRALLHGRDPFLWTNVNSNFGFHINYDD